MEEIKRRECWHYDASSKLSATENRARATTRRCLKLTESIVCDDDIPMTKGPSLEWSALWLPVMHWTLPDMLKFQPEHLTMRWSAGSLENCDTL